ncbi:TonB family protein [Sphingobium sp. HWE2-09]|uniref:energy transducer TonB n=1 Tax=Sphingobium sp. HWE2-09 TaxID=3108390 RepID=UPI002DD27E1C|nr:TonB family protein [Sphingobium sp. HWE2-09]
MKALSVSGQATGTTSSGDGRSHYGAGHKSPLGLGGTIAVHGLLIGAFLLLPKEVIDVFTPTPPMTAHNIPIDSPPPPPEVAKDSRTESTLPTRPQPRQPTAADPEVVLPSDDPVVTGGRDLGGDPLPPVILPPIDPPRAPVLTEAAIDPRALSAFQPDYPGAMIRQGAEGVVTVRVTISPDGRVTDIEKLSASDESFWLATQRHALRKWRFRPATRDGVAVGSTKTLTVRFTLTER